MAISVKELIAKRESIENAKKIKFDIETSVGTITVKQPTIALVTEALELENSNEYLIYECVVEPNLKDQELVKAYKCHVPTDIVEKVFRPGEIPALATAILQTAGYNQDITVVAHDTIKK